MKIYVITQGEYSDYKIIATAISESVAKEICDNYNKGVSQVYSENYIYKIEEFDLLEKLEDFNLGNDIWFEIRYESQTKKITIDHDYNGYRDNDYLFIDNKNDNHYVYIIFLESNAKNLLGYEKIMKEKIAQIDYEIQNTFNGDVTQYIKYRDELNKEMPF